MKDPKLVRRPDKRMGFGCTPLLISLALWWAIVYGIILIVKHT